MTTADDVRRVMDRVASIRKLAAEGYITPKGDMADLLVLADEREELIAVLAEIIAADVFLELASLVGTSNAGEVSPADRWNNAMEAAEAVHAKATGEQHA